ncbi:MAG: cytochrome c oxidase accessory protein CcoG [Planctomycetota bacterium]|nr:cytochrome c oxidase accessory protein CcoG [Planctomycetota bacterium]
MSSPASQSRRPDLDSLYCVNPDGSRNTIHPADVKGRFQARKKIVWSVLFVVWVVLPWLRVGGQPAILIDLANRQFLLFGATFNAQDFYLAYFLLTGVGFSLFVLSALFGRVWCGYACPHTVFLEGFYRRIERWSEGSATQRKRLEAMPWNLEKVLRRGGKWLVFAAFSAFLSHNFLSYFMGAERVLDAMTSPPGDHPTAFAFALVFTVIIYVNFAWFREQLCIVICPYGRLQGVLYDEDTVNVGYDAKRGEPRGKYSQGERGDCIDCFRCVAVCPTGIDIRNGTQLECVGCANCIDACDEVMARLGQEPGLVRYDSKRGLDGLARRFVRPRLLLYAFLFVLGATVFAVAASRRTPFEAAIIRPQGTPYLVQDGIVRNPLFVHLVNKQPRAHSFRIEAEAPEGVRVLLPRTEVELESLADERISFLVEFDRSVYEPELQVVLHIRTADGGLELHPSMVLLGPR